MCMPVGALVVAPDISTDDEPANVTHRPPAYICIHALHPPMPRERVQTRADPDTVGALDQLADAKDISRSEAVRRALRAGLAAEGYPIAATDGSGELADRLEAIEARQAKQEQTDRLHTAALLTGVLYIVATLTLGLSGQVWLLAGIGTLAAVVLATYLRNQTHE